MGYFTISPDQLGHKKPGTWSDVAKTCNSIHGKNQQVAQ